MKYQISREKKIDLVIVDILEVVNFILLTIIAGCFNYLVINFLF